MRLNGRFGRFGGCYVPEILVPALEQLEAAFLDSQQDPSFADELNSLLANYAGRPTPLTRCRNLPQNIYLKREDLLHGGAHKTNQVLAQGLLAKRMGKTRLIAETGAGQHGVATAIVGALLGFDTVIYMGAEDVERQQLNVFRMRLMGAEVVPVESGEDTARHIPGGVLKIILGMGHDLANGLIPILVEAIADHCLAADAVEVRGSAGRTVAKGSKNGT